jgi:hypothetical protein
MKNEISLGSLKEFGKNQLKLRHAKRTKPSNL